MRLIENQTQRAFTLHELLIVILVVAGMALLAVQAMAQVAKRSPRIQCANNLMQISIAFRVWAGNHLDRYPQMVSSAQGGAMINGAAILPINTYIIFQVMSNELNTPKIVVCPSDGERNATTNFLNVAGRGNFNNLTVSYWVGRDADQTTPQMFLAGDRNVYGTSASVPGPTPAVMAGYGNSPPSGMLSGSLVAIGTNVNSTLNPRPVGFTDRMHRQAGNVAMADGSVQQLTSLRFYAARSQTGDTTILAPGQNTLLFP
jgi:prepilin-type N-terminal cleavage/methylation domain-containing protein/prepilin-type processing-associated H-X9-DG protein